MQNDTPLGPYTQEIRNNYIAYRSAKYLIDHPGATQHKAAKYARVAWSRKVKKAVQSKPVTVSTIVDLVRQWFKNIDPEHAGTVSSVEEARSVKTPNGEHLYYITLGWSDMVLFNEKKNYRLFIVDCKAMEIRSMHNGTIDDYESKLISNAPPKPTPKPTIKHMRSA